jgi:cyanophycinase
MATKIILAFCFCALLSLALSKTTLYLTGSAVDSVVTSHGPVIDVSGGSTDVDKKSQDVIDKIRGCTGSCTTKIDIVILRKTGTGAYNDYLYAMDGVNSVRTYILTTANDANAVAVETAIKNAEYVFYAGGDQCDYITYFKGTKVETATEFVYNKGGSVGGTSAGAAILGEYINDGCGSAQGVASSTALANPYDKSITFTYNYFNFNFLNKVITDQHFVARDRMGRLLVFLARQIKDNKTTTAWGVAANEETSVVVDELGIATVVSNDGVTQYGDQTIPPASLNPVAYYILLDHPCATVVAKTPLTCAGYEVWKRTTGQTFNLATRLTSNPDYTINVQNGVINVVGNNGNIY